MCESGYFLQKVMLPQTFTREMKEEKYKKLLHLVSHYILLVASLTPNVNKFHFFYFSTAVSHRIVSVAGSYNCEKYSWPDFCEYDSIMTIILNEVDFS